MININSTTFLVGLCFKNLHLSGIQFASCMSDKSKFLKQKPILGLYPITLVVILTFFESILPVFFTV